MCLLALWSEVLERWRADMTKIAEECPNVYVKVWAVQV